MTNFIDFNLVFDTLVQYFTGSYPVLALTILGIFALILIAAGLDIRYTGLFMLPMAAFLVGIGWFGIGGASTWIVNIILIIISVFYAIAVIRLTT